MRPLNNEDTAQQGYGVSSSVWNLVCEEAPACVKYRKLYLEARSLIPCNKLREISIAVLFNPAAECRAYPYGTAMWFVSSPGYSRHREDR